MNIEYEDFTGEGKDDKDGHGTHCAGIIAGQDVDGIRIGVARKVKKMLVAKVFGENGGGTTEMLIDALNWALQNGANVISMSLGIDFPGYVAELEKEGKSTELAVSQALKDYLHTVKLFESLVEHYSIARRDGRDEPIIIVCASGNESQRLKDENFVITCSPPASCDGIISVGAVGYRDNKFYLADFSNCDATLVAPGVDIISARTGGGLIESSGTSMATPYVAGIAALWVENLKNAGKYRKDLIESNIKSNVTNDNFDKKYSVEDVGAGVIFAPQTQL